jgi:hypothetical protein
LAVPEWCLDAEAKDLKGVLEMLLRKFCEGPAYDQPDEISFIDSRI